MKKLTKKVITTLSNDCKSLKKYANKTTLLLLFILIIISYLSSIYVINNKIDIGSIRNFNIWSMFLFMLVYSFVFGYFVFPIKKYNDFIYRRRYLICFFIFLVLVLGKFNGSSIGMWNKSVEPSEDFSSNTIIGENRAIRSDEWRVNTPYAFSQKYNNYKYFSNLPRGTKTDMFSTIFVPVKDILILARPFNIGYLLFGEEYGLSIYWYGRLIALLLVTFEMFMLITDKKRLPSVVGTFLIAGSSAVQWWYSNYIIDLLISGQLCLLIFNAMLNTKNKKLKVLYSVLIAFSFNWFALTLYPAWQIPLGYMYLLMAIWIIAKNKTNTTLKDYSYLLISFAIIVLFILRYFVLGIDTIKIIMSTAYPGKRMETGGNIGIYNFIYPISIFFPVYDYLNPCEASGTYSLFPVPIIISIFYLVKNRKLEEKDKEKLLLTMLTMLCIILSLYTMVKFPKIVAKATLLNMSPANRIYPIVSIICTYILIMLIGKIKVEKKLTKCFLFIVSVVISIIILHIGISAKSDYMTTKKFIVAAIILIIAMYTFLTSYRRKNMLIFSVVMILLGISNILLVNPVNIGTGVTHNKSAAKEIRKIVKQDNDGKWISLDSSELQNYVLMNGGRVINSTNIYPNLKLWKKIDKNGKYNKIYNRYAHIIISLTQNKTDFELTHEDVFKLNLKCNDINKLKVNYVISNNKLSVCQANFNEIYHKDNIWIYKFTR